MSTQAYNLLWLSLKLLPEGAEPSSFVEPIPPKTLENMLRIARSNPTVDVRLWVDSRRVTDAQIRWLQEMTQKCESGNFTIDDLRTIEEYDSNNLFNQSDDSGNWQHDKHSLIWRQVDAAKLFICLQGDYDQMFYSDADTAIDIVSEGVQKALNEHGLVARGVFANGNFSGFENQAFGFNRTRVDFARRLYYQTLDQALFKERNGYTVFIDSLRDLMGKTSEKIAIHTEHDGTAAWHPNEQNISWMK